MNLGVRLRDFRMKKDMTLKDVKEKTGISISFLSDIERGRTNPALDTLQALADLYETPLSYLFLDVRIEKESK